MSPVRIDYLPPISTITGKISESLHLEKTTPMEEFLTILADKYGPNFRNLFWDSDNKLRMKAIINLNGILVRNFNAPVSPDSVLLIVPIISGG